MGNSPQRLALAACLLGVVGGCGLADYEKQMLATYERLKQMDDEDRVLGNMVAMPSGKDPFGNEIRPPFVIFMRVPRYLRPTPELAVIHDQVALFRYPCRADAFKGWQDFNLLLAWSKIKDPSAAPPPKDKLGTDKGTIDQGASGPPPDPEFTVDEFHKRVQGALVDYILRTMSLHANVQDIKKADPKKYHVLRDGRPVKLDFECETFTDPRGASVFKVHYVYAGFRQAAVIFQLPTALASDAEFHKMVEFSLKTVNITPSAGGQRAKFNFRG
ncbi:MAG: hypothetical protein NZO58_00355 [Gemmataceae bacterium]|nr:hypothetical protein [Gemmataceae bacterium]